MKKNSFADLELCTYDSITFFNNTFPVKIHIKDVKWIDFGYSLEGQEPSAELREHLHEKSIEKCIDIILDSVDWERTTFELNSKEYNEVYSEEKNRKEGMIDFYKLDQLKIEFQEKYKYNIKKNILNKISIDRNDSILSSKEKICLEIKEVYEYIYIEQRKLTEKFVSICNELMRIKETEDMSFREMAQIFVKSANHMGNTPIFPENFNKSFSDFSFREIKLRTLYEEKEYSINIKTMANLGRRIF